MGDLEQGTGASARRPAPPPPVPLLDDDGLVVVWWQRCWALAHKTVLNTLFTVCGARKTSWPGIIFIKLICANPPPGPPSPNPAFSHPLLAAAGSAHGLG